MVLFSSPFDETVDYLEKLDAPCHKYILESTDHGLLRKVAATGKPVIRSTDASIQILMSQLVFCGALV